MKTVYVVLPFSNNYGRPLTEKMQVFSKRADADKFADNIKYVEIITTKLR